MKKDNKIKALTIGYSPKSVEEEVLEHWKKNKIFERSVEERSEDNAYRFFDGPPFVTGKPHYGHLLGSIVKDVIPRFQAMKGKRVERVWGWDCHGLPAENKVEKELGLNSKKEIEDLGIDKFVAACKSYVGNVSAEWEWYIDHIGRWVDFKNAYRTMDLPYMESVLWVFKELYKKGVIYKGKRVSLFCPRCSTPISNFEVAMDNSYKDVTDPSVFVKFRLKDEPDTFLLAWTTTPWTLPSNFALAISPESKYVKVVYQGENLILAKDRLEPVMGDLDYKILETINGSDLSGLVYEPLYDYYQANEKDHRLYSADFVSMNDGTGIVHVAPGFGEDDTELGKTHNLSMAETVDETGKMDPAVLVAEGKYFKSADKLIIADLERRGLLLKSTTITHSYPHCHRCETPLLYKAQTAWYINVQKTKEQLKDTNHEINWVPEHFKHGRFELGIDSAPDWCISRTRYWGTPIPVWECEDCDEKIVIGSLLELEELSGKKITDLHRPDIDEVLLPCPKCGKTARRVPEVLDSWVEAASMPYAQVHYPFENEKKFKDSFPADFITEYTGQLRAWFYVMHVISNLLFDSIAFKNVIVTGVIQGTDGRKMSKNYGNFPDPKDSLEKYGADSLRLYLMGSPIVLGQDIAISEKDWGIERSTLMILWNSYKYFASYASLENWESKIEFKARPTVLDEWILTRLDQTVLDINENLEGYQIPKAVTALKSFVEDLSTWYIRRSRDRVGPVSEDLADKELAYTTMNTVFTILFKVAAPLVPFISEYLYRHLTGEESVHLADWPDVQDRTVVNTTLLTQMTLVRKICEMGNAERKKLGIAIKQPLASIKVSGHFELIEKDDDLTQLIKDELNVEDVTFETAEVQAVEYDTEMTPHLKDKGRSRELIRAIQEARKEAGCLLDERIDLELPDWPAEFEKDIKKKTLVDNLSRGETVKIVRSNK